MVTITDTLHIKGYLDYDDGIPVVKEKEDSRSYYGKSIPQMIEDFARYSGFVEDYETGLGGTKSYIPNVNMSLYVGSRECSLDEMIVELVNTLIGSVSVNVSLEGYSEWTITGYCLEDFSIGGHDLDQELRSYEGKYIHLVLKV